MENYSNYSSYPESRDSSPRSREIVDCDAASWDEQQQAYKVKVMCSYGGRIQPRPHDNQLAYVGGDTKILSLDRSVRLPALLAKLASLCPDDRDLCFKYQLPGEDLDALISVTNDEDLDHMMIEYDRLLHRASNPSPARLRLFLFSEKPSSAAADDRHWFVDALNSVQPDAPPSPAPPDFLFGLDKPPPPSSDEPSAAEIQRQIQRLQIAAQEQRKYDEIGNPRAYAAAAGGDFYSQSFKPPPEKLPAAPPPPANIPAPMSMPMQLPAHFTASYVSERHVAAGGFHVAAPPPGNPLSAPPPPPPQAQLLPPPPGSTEQPVYLIQTPGGVFHHHAASAQLRPVSAPLGQPFYGVHHPRMVPESVYRDAAAAQVYNTAPPMMQPQKPPELQQQQPGFAQVGYDSAGRQVYYTTTAAASAYQNVPPVSVDGRQAGSAGAVASLSQDGKVVVGKASQSSAM